MQLSPKGNHLQPGLRHHAKDVSLSVGNEPYSSNLNMFMPCYTLSGTILEISILLKAYAWQ